MITPAEVVGGVAIVTVFLILYVVARPRLSRKGEGRLLVFLPFCPLPILVTLAGTQVHLDGATSTQFCLSCHEMSRHGESLEVDEAEHLPALHFQNNWVPRDKACYTCHTEYTMFGGVNAKLRGVNHVRIHYLGTPPEPADISLYTAFKNQVCLHCHGEARRYLEIDEHREQRAEILSEELSCMECHEYVHDLEELDELPKWNGAGE